MRTIIIMALTLCFLASEGSNTRVTPEIQSQPFDNQETADIIYFNGKIVTMDVHKRIVSAVAVKAGKILALGADQEIMKFAGNNTVKIDLQKRTMLPGLIDAHAHPMETLYLSTAWVDCRYPGVPSVKQALNNISKAADTIADGQWIFAACVSASQNKFLEKRMPTKAELDSICPDHPLVVADGAHLCIVNAQALKALGVKPGMTKLPNGGNIILDKDGNPTGALGDAEGDLPTTPTIDQITEYFSSGIQSFWNHYGFTSILAIVPAQAYPVLQSIAGKGYVPEIRYVVSVWTSPGGADMPDDLSKYAFPKGTNPDFYRFSGIKAWMDGENDARTGLMYQCYLGHYDTDPPGNCGVQLITQENCNRLAEIAQKAKVMCMFHCAGDKATDMGLTAFENLVNSGNTGTPMRLEHFGMFQLTPAQLEKAKALRKHGLHISVQPVWLTALVNANFENMGAERASTGFQFKSMIDAGLEPAASTDMTGIYLENTNPFKAMGAMVTRQTDRGVFGPEQAIDVMDALKMWTIWAAKSMGIDKQTGSVEVGKYADFVVISEDILTIDPEKIKDIQVLRTVVGGKTVFESR